MTNQKTMKCEDLQFNLSIHLDEVLTDAERSALDEHLTGCVSCRLKLAEFEAMRRDLRMMTRPAAPSTLISSVRRRMADEISSQNAKVPVSSWLAEWKRVYLIPSGIGTAASLIFGFGLLWALLSAGTGEKYAIYNAPGSSTVLLSNLEPKDEFEFGLSPADFARARMSVSGESPSINPQGALIALTKSFVRGEMNDDEVVVVADVFGDGLARIAEVVEPSKDRMAVRELEKALKSNPDYAPPFVPASIDHRADTVRVVLKFQTVQVDTEKAPG